jgi:hypothetical protein
MVSHHQNARQNHNLVVAKKSKRNVVRLKHLGTTVTNQNCIYKEIKSTINLANACYHSFKNPFPLRTERLKCREL